MWILFTFMRRGKENFQSLTSFIPFLPCAFIDKSYYRSFFLFFLSYLLIDRLIVPVYLSHLSSGRTFCRVCLVRLWSSLIIIIEIEMMGFDPWYMLRWAVVGGCLVIRYECGRRGACFGRVGCRFGGCGLRFWGMGGG